MVIGAYMRRVDERAQTSWMKDHLSSCAQLASAQGGTFIIQAGGAVQVDSKKRQITLEANMLQLAELDCFREFVQD